MPVGRHGYLALPPPRLDRPRRYAARVADLGDNRTARDLASVVGAWDEERGERAQTVWQGLEDVLREG
jgi:hypothetical protein